jgi:hypothetical protein
MKTKSLSELIKNYDHADTEMKRLELAMADALKNDVATALEKAVAIFPKLQKSTRDLFWCGPKFNDTLKALGLAWVPFPEDNTSRKRTNGTARAPRIEITEEQLLAFLGDAKRNQGVIATHFKTTTQTIKDKLMPLKTAGKVDFKDLGKGKGKGVQWFRV